jgi:hypothetical protein
LASQKGYKRPIPNPWVTWKIENGKWEIGSNGQFILLLPIFNISYFPFLIN